MIRNTKTFQEFLQESVFHRGLGHGHAGLKPDSDDPDYMRGYEAGARIRNSKNAKPTDNHYSDDKFGERHARDSTGHLD